MGLIVCKFGGTSVGTLEKMRNVAARIIEMYREGNDVVMVISAMGKTTDELLAKAGEISDQNSRRELDMLMATGEQQSAAYMAMTVNSMGVPAVSFSCFQAGIYCDANHTKAKLLNIEPWRIQKALAEGKIVIVAGFQGMTPANDVATLGRGGSDTTAIALAAALKATSCKIFTDVDGVYTADPRVVPEAAKLSTISYDEMLEMASLGAGVMQPRAVECAMVNQVDFEVLSSFNHNPGTIVTGGDKMEKQRIVSGVAHDLNTAKIAVFDVPDKPGSAMRIFKELAEAKINVDMVIQSAVRGAGKNDIAFTIEKDELDKALPILQKIVSDLGASGMSYGKDVAKVSIVGAGMQSNIGVAANMFEALADANINIEMISTSEIKISCIIAAADVEKAVRLLHQKFELERES